MIAMMTMRARVLAVTSWWDLVPLETRQSLYAAVMVTAAFAVFLVLSLCLISIAGRQWRAPKMKNLNMKKSSIDVNQYLDCL